MEEKNLFPESPIETPSEESLHVSPEEAAAPSTAREENTPSEAGETPSETSETTSEAEEKPKKKGFRAWWSAHKPTKRRLIQLYAALLTNANIKGFASGKIYTGATKNVCVPGLNCYSCPGAVGACPLGSLQNALAQSGTRAPFYVIGIILLFGLILGRTICGFLCPFGLVQDLVYKIKTPKLKKSRVTRVLSYLKYVFLVVFVIALPISFGAYGATAVPAFCKYICPAGTLLGAAPLLANGANAEIYSGLGALFTWKFALMVAIIAACIFIYRAFCRFFCPLGALYGFFNRIALLGVKLDKTKCTDCGLCVAHCKMDIHRVGDHECINCGECIPVCPAKAISWKGEKIFVHASAVEAPAAEGNALSMLSVSPAEAVASPVQTEKSLASFAQAASSEAVAPPVPAPAKPARARKTRGFWLQLGAWIVALAVLVGALVYYNFFDEEQKTIEPVASGDVVPDFTLSCYNGRESFTLSEARGKVVFVNFWGTWCGPCVLELPYFQQLKEKYGDDIEVVAVHSVYSPEPVQDYLDKKDDALDPSRKWKDWDIIFAQDTGEGVYSETFTLLGGVNNGYPVTAVIDRSGVLQVVVQESVTYDELDLYASLFLA